MPFVRLLSAGLVVCLSAILAFAVPSFAQGNGYGVPLAYPGIDGNGVDLATGIFTTSSPEISIGDPGAGGLSYSQLFIGSNWRHSLWGTIDSNPGGTSHSVSVFGSTERFTTWSAGQQAFLPERETGATLKPTGYQMTYTASNGMVAVFDPVNSYEVFYPETQNDMEWVIRSVTLPNGTRYDFTYQSVVLGTYHCIEGPPECEPTYEAMFKRLQSVTTNHGYQLHLEYA